LPETAPRKPDRTGAKVLLLLLSLAWGLSWPVMRIALEEVTPWTLRLVGYATGVVFMFAVVKLRRRAPALPFGRSYLHVTVSAVLNVVGFGLFSSFAQLQAMTARVAIIVYSMPIWASVTAWLLLGEGLTRPAIVGLVLCVCGLAVLITPLAGAGVPLGLVLALGSALSWAAGTLYLKWARIPGDRIAITGWQLVVSLAVIAVCLAIFEGAPHLWPLRPTTIVALVFHGVIATGLAYLLWFEIVERLPVATASLGSLCVPVVGILSSIAILGERPSLIDAIGFALILAAAAAVLIEPATRPVASTRSER